MPAVPYQPYPTTQPTTQGAPMINVDTPAAAFGGATAAATTQAGSEVSAASTELFNRAIAMQQLNNETEAKNKNIDFMIAAGELHAKYNALQGQDRVAAYPKYASDLQKLYIDHRSSLGNPTTKRMFDASAVSVMNRSLFSGAAAAGTAQREAVLGAANAEFDLNTKAVYNDPNDESQFEEALAKNKASAAQKAALTAGGFSPQRAELIEKNGASTLAYNRILGIARTDPDKAYQLYQTYSAKGLLFGPQAEQAQAKVQALIHSVGMNNLANGILSKHRQEDGTFDSSFKDLQQEARDTATKKYPDDPGAGLAAASAIDRNYNQIRWAAVQDQRARSEQINSYILKGVDNVNMLPPSLTQQMTAAEIKAFPGKVAGYRASVERVDDQVERARLLGMYNSDNAKFMDENILGNNKLSRGSMNFFLNLQRHEAANGDPRVNRAIGWIRGAAPATLQELGIYRRTTDNTNDYDNFVGTLHEAIQAYQETYNKPPDEKAITKEIFPSVIRQVTQPGWLWNSSTPLYNVPLPDAIREAGKKDLGENATDEQIRQAWMRAQFMKLYAGSRTTPAKSQSRAPQGPSVPVSQ